MVSRSGSVEELLIARKNREAQREEDRDAVEPRSDKNVNKQE
jgi:hypothetical protein